MSEENGSDYEVVNHSSCSRCLAVETCVTPLAWTLSTLRQTSHESPRPLRSSRNENNSEATSTSELLRQYRILQVRIERWNKH